MRARLRAGVAAVVLTAACVGCDSGSAAVDRGAAIAEARQEMGPPAAQLGTAAATVGARAETLADAPGDPALASLQEAVTDLRSAVDDADAVDVAAEVPDVEAAAAAFDVALSSASELANAADQLADAAEVLLQGSAELETVRSGWDESGSFSQQLVRFDELVLDAEEAATALDDLEAPGCPSVVDDLQDAGEAVVAGTVELRDLVEARDGAAFDERRIALADDPFGLGVTSLPPPMGGDCPTVSDVADLVDDVVGALGELEAALNPADLSGQGG